MAVGAPGLAVAPKVTGDRAPLDAWTVTAPAVALRVRVSAARPDTSVMDDVAGLSVPVPDVMPQLTVTPETGFPPASVTRTFMAWSFAPMVSVCASPALFARFAAGPAVAVARKLTGPRPPPVATSVSILALEPNVHDGTVATPEASVSGVPGGTDPLAEEAGANVTPKPCTGFPNASVTVT
jgi:hypothetical protein